MARRLGALAPNVGRTLAAAAAAGAVYGHAVLCDDERRRPLRVAFMGNSYLYFNDVPRTFQALCGGDEAVQVRDCLRGGSSWKTLREQGNGMRNKFKTPNALLPDGTLDIGAPTVEALLQEHGGWDFVVMNTYSQSAAGAKGRAQDLEQLRALAPLFGGAGASPVLMPTPAYRKHTKGSERIGDWQAFTWRQSEGFVLYASALAGLCPKERRPRVAEVNRAFELVHGERPELWRELFHDDDFHPSALGSFLEACVIYCTIFGHAPPLSQEALANPASLWARARRMLPEGKVGRMPTEEEMLYLHGVAARCMFAAELSGYQTAL